MSLALSPIEVPRVSPEQVAVMADAAAGLRKARRAAGAARFSGWTLGIFAVCTALGGLTDPLSLSIAVGLAVIAWSEFQGAAGVNRFNLSAPKRLVANQFALLGLILVYSGANVWRTLTAAAAPGLEPTGDVQVDNMLGEFDGLVRQISVAVYVAVAVIGVPVQLLMASYHSRRGRQMRECLARTPGWAVDVARAA